jgi:hypothetical protein
MPCLRSSQEKEWNQVQVQVLRSATPQRGVQRVNKKCKTSRDIQAE